MTKQFKADAWGLDNRMTIVLFAGLGGACDGLERAGFQVHVAINHDPVAIAVHKKRHPHTLHLQTDVFEVDPVSVVKGRGVRFLHASPDCTHFSVAKGGKPVSKRRRSLAWVVCRWMGKVRPEVVTLENVREIQSWGPLIAKRDPAGRVVKLDGSVAAKGEHVKVQDQWLIPDPRHKGRIWRAWLKHVAKLGFRFEHRELVCADYGIWTIRKRLFGVATSDGMPIVWPERTHAPRHLAKKLKLRPWRGIWEKIDWSRPVKSIFDRPKALAEATNRRIARGIVRYVIKARRPFIAPITHSGDPNRVHSVDEPLRTLTTAHRGEMSVIVPHLSVMRNSAKPDYAADEPAHTFTAGGAGHMLVSTFLAQHNDGPRAGLSCWSATDPVSALTTTGSQQGIVAASMLALRGTNKDGRDARDPMAAMTAGGTHAGVILAFLQHYFSSGKTSDGLDEPLGALTGKVRHGLVTVKVDGTDYVITDICQRMLEPEEGAAAHGFEPGALPDEIEIDGKVRRLTKTEKYHLVGNSVPPEMIRLLAVCNGRRELMVAAE